RGRLKHERWYFLLLYLFSILIDSDKLDSAQIGHKYLNNLPSRKVKEHITEKHAGEIDNTLIQRRDQARNTIVGEIKKLTDEELIENRIFTLTAPTGIGK